MGQLGRAEPLTSRVNSRSEQTTLQTQMKTKHKLAPTSRVEVINRKSVMVSDLPAVSNMIEQV